ncbi:hypothetical protein ID866_7336 [Astraeus odoratus]|nr:hypothetical protein ID866_7336 [Astraeus odoratus]
MEAHAFLELLADGASAQDINLNDNIERDESFPPLHSGNTTVHLGTLRAQRQAVALKSIRLSPTRVNVCNIYNIDIHSFNLYFSQHIIREIRLWSQLRHKNIAPVFGVITKYDSAVSIVTKWMPQGNAYDYVQNKDIDPRPLLLHVALGLQYLHGQGLTPILHGNLRARNVLISEDGRALLADYGLSALIESSFDTTFAAPIPPTVRWMAPELIDNGKPTIQSDVWAFGMTALELFTRSPPYSDIRDIRSVIRRILEGPPSRPTDESTCFRMTDAWWEICTSCWERSEASRPPISCIAEKVKTLVGVLVRIYLLERAKQVAARGWRWLMLARKIILFPVFFYFILHNFTTL